jgi:F0F1-type ATP synthase epsilon subunit
MKVEILTIFKSLFSAQADEAILPGEDGEISVWDLHQPCLYSLRAGKIIIRDRSKVGQAEGPNKSNSIPIKRGLAIIGENKLTAMVEI